MLIDDSARVPLVPSVAVREAGHRKDDPRRALERPQLLLLPLLIRTQTDNRWSARGPSPGGPPAPLSRKNKDATRIWGIPVNGDGTDNESRPTGFRRISQWWASEHPFVSI
jgi:hypothetical protein